MTKINIKSNNVKVKGHRGTWYVIEEGWNDGEKIFLMEHEKYGSDTAWIIVNENGALLLEDCWNGFMDL